MKKISVLIVDDHEVVRRGLTSFLEVQDQLEVKGEAENGEEAIKAVQELRPDVVLMDLVMPGMDGIEAIRRMKKLVPDIRIIVFTSFAENDKVFPAIEAGVDGYLLKDTAPADLVKAIESAYAGNPTLHPEVAQKLMMRVSNRSSLPATQTLTQREMEILELLAKGLTNDGIAEKLFISVTTVKTHVHNILRKLGMTNRIQAALYATDKKLPQ